MLHFYFARVFAYFAARMIVPLVWWFFPTKLLPWIQFNGGWFRDGLDYLIRAAPPPWNDIARVFLYITDKVGDAVQWILPYAVSTQTRDHVEVLAKAFFTPGGWLMLGQLTLVIFVVIRTWRWWRKRRELRKEASAERKEPIL